MGQAERPGDAGERGRDPTGALTGDVRSVEDGDRYVHVRFCDPDVFETIRTPDWASQSVLVRKPVGAGTAIAVARQVREKIGE